MTLPLTEYTVDFHNAEETVHDMIDILADEHLGQACTTFALGLVRLLYMARFPDLPITPEAEVQRVKDVLAFAVSTVEFPLPQTPSVN